MKPPNKYGIIKMMIPDDKTNHVNIHMKTYKKRKKFQYIILFPGVENDYDGLNLFSTRNQTNKSK